MALGSYVVRLICFTEAAVPGLHTIQFPWQFPPDLTSKLNSCHKMMMKYLHNSKYLCMTICNSKWCRYLRQHQMVWILVCISVGSNPKITNFKLLQTWLVKLCTHSNPGSSTKTELWTYSNSFKKPKLRTCSARNKLNHPGPNLKKSNFEPCLPNPGEADIRQLIGI